MRSPVLFIIFNRPDTTEIVFEAIRKARPPKLYIASDGPRPDHPDDIEKVEKCRKIAGHVDWPCDIFTKFEDRNLGCGPGPANAISWIFEYEDRAIILEDDCVPAQSFLPFCDELLEKYKDDTRVWTISGNNFYEDIELPYSYIFSNYGHSWGWATWRRCWKHFDLKMSGLDEFLKIGGFENVFLTKKEAKYFDKKYQFYKNRESYSEHVWDVQANFMIKSNRGLSIIPRYNLVKNIGIQGTHAKKKHQYHNRNINNNFRIDSHPKYILPYQKYDAISFKNHYLIPSRFDKYLYRSIKKVFNKL